MSALLLMDTKHKLETGQDIFRAKTVRAIMAQLDAQADTIAALTAENAKLRRIAVAALDVKMSLRQAEKAPKENGWVMAAPQYFREQADKLDDALKGDA